jgi:hypothetical protein
MKSPTRTQVPTLSEEMQRYFDNPLPLDRITAWCWMQRVRDLESEIAKLRTGTENSGT